MPVDISLVTALCSSTAAAVDVTLLGRYYERFADHAVQLAHRVIFQTTGRYYDCETAST